jgi:Uma2 family endonuclease
MDAMTIPDVWSGQDRALTVEDMENMPDDEFRYELDDGVLIVSPAPSTLHQLAVTRLAVILSAQGRPEARRPRHCGHRETPP